MQNEEAKRRFAEDTGAFVALVDALLADETSRQQFALDPIGVLERHGIRFANDDARAEIAERLREAAEAAQGEDVVKFAATCPYVKAGTRPGVQVAIDVAVCIFTDSWGTLSAAAGEKRRAVEVDTGRVSESLELAALNQRIRALEDEVLRLQKRDL